MVGLYLAEGCVSSDAHGEAIRERILWSFHPRAEEHLVDEVAVLLAIARSQGPLARHPHRVELTSPRGSSQRGGPRSSGRGRTSYDQRVPDLVWEQSVERKKALLSGLWEGDGSWSLVNRGPSVILEWGTVSDELADGVARLLGELGIVCSWRRGRTAKSTKETHWLRVSGAEQIEQRAFPGPGAAAVERA